MARFVIDTGDLKLDDKQVVQLERELQEITAKHVLGLARPGPVVTKFPKGWAGGIWGSDFDLIDNIESSIGNTLGQE